MQKPWVVGGGIAFAGVVVAVFLVAFGWAMRAKNGAVAQANQATAASAAAEADRRAAAASAIASADRADKERAVAAASARAAAVKYLATLDATERAERVRNCVVGVGCSDLPDLLASAKNDTERAKLQRLVSASRIESAAAQGHDGSKVSGAAFATLGVLVTEGPAALDALPTTTMGKAKKDPDEERGKLMRVSGTILQIHSEGGNETGTMSTDGGGFVYFASPFKTDLTEDSWASFKGAFVQEYDYKNVSGGETQSVLLVGKFN